MKKLILSLLFLSLTLSLVVPLQAERFVPKSDLIPQVLIQVRDSYVDAKRIRPVKMLQGSLDRLSGMIIPVMTKMKVKGRKVSITLKMDEFRKTLRYAKPKTVRDLNIILQEVALFTKQHLEASEKPETVDYALINGFLSKLDPHTTLLVPDVYTDFSASTSGNFGGVGMMIGIRDGKLTVVSPIDDTPASRAGLKAKDNIVQINEESTINMPLDEAVSKLRGPVGTKVVIHLMRKGFTAPRKYEITRALIKITSVESHKFTDPKGTVGYLQIKTFQGNTMDELNEHLLTLDYELEGFQGLVLDLRNNPGGLLSQAIGVSNRFLESGTIVSTAGLDPNSIHDVPATWFDTIKDIPIIVLVNNGSASASEIVAAALKANGRALLIGDQTFGKGSVQEVIPFRDGSALKITKSKYLTPGNRSIQSVGVTPHIKVNELYVSQSFLRLTHVKDQQLEKSLEGNYKEWGDKPDKEEKLTYYLNGSAEEHKTKKEKEAEESLSMHAAMIQRLEKDFLVQSAIQILLQNQKQGYRKLFSKDKGAQYLNKSGHSFFDKNEVKEQDKIVSKFKKLKVDWSHGKTVRNAKVRTRSWIEVKGKKDKYRVLKGPALASSDLRLYLEVTNKGKQTLSRVMAMTKSANSLLGQRQLAFGKLKPGESRRWYIPMQLTKSAISRNDLIELEVKDISKKVLTTEKLVLQVKSQERPRFKYSYKLDKDLSQIQAGDKIKITLDVSNTGKGKSGPLTLLLKNGEGERLFLSTGRASLKSLKPKASKTVSFVFEVKSMPEDQDLDFSIDVIDGTFPLSSLNQKVKFPLAVKETSWSNEAPRFQLAGAKNTARKAKYILRGKIFDDKGVKDLVVILNNKKVHYQNFQKKKNRKSVKLNLSLKLKKGVNRLLLVSRDDHNVDSKKAIYVRNLTSK